MRELLIGLDGGTGGMRAFVFDKQGNVLGSADAPYETVYPQSGWAEQRPADWWQATCTSLRQAMEKANVTADRVAALCAATTSCTVMTCGKDGSTDDNALLWMDVRATQQAKAILDATGEAPSAEHFPSKALWIKQNQPERWAKAEVLCEYQDWMNYRLTGRWCFSVNTACNWGYNKRKGGFYTDFYNKCGLEDAFEKMPAEAVCAGEKVGYLTAEAAAQLGLDTEVMVAQGGIDASIGMLGMGVNKPGTAAMMTGSSNLVMAATTKPVFCSEESFNAGPDFLLEGCYTSVQGQVSTGSILRWFRREFARDLDEKECFKLLDKAAAEIEIGAGGLTLLDYWQGNRTPYNDADVRGMVYGLSMSTTREAIFRAVLEGIACGTEDMLEQFRKAGCPVEELYVSGGTTRSPLFMQIHADVSGIPMKITSDYSVALGSAVCAAHTAGFYTTIPEAVEKMVRPAGTVLPDPDRHAAYKPVLERYRGIYAALRPWIHQK